MVLQGVASNPSTPLHLLRKLAGWEYSSVREEVAMNPSTPAIERVALSRDGEEDVRFYFA